MVQNFALAALVALFATATLASPAGEATPGQNPSEKDAKATTEGADATKKEEPKKEEEKK